MKNLLLGLILLAGSVSIALAQEDFFGDLMISDEMKQQEIRKAGQSAAGKLLESRPTKFKLDRNKGRIKEVEKEEAAPIVREPAPFGLKWLATINEIRYLHVQLSPFEAKDLPETYSATNLPKPVSAFRQVLISFGENDALWRIAAYSKFIKDNNAASQGVEEYKKYYDMLAKKYGNAQQFYTPAVTNIEEKIDSGDGTSSIAVRQEKMEIGAEGFLQKLMSGESVLYSTFDNGRVGVTLALLANGNGETYIVVDYKNLTATKLENEEIYDAL